MHACNNKWAANMSPIRDWGCTQHSTMNKLRVYQVVVFVTLYVAYGFFYYTRKSVSFMLPHLGNEAVVSSSSSSLDTSLINDDITNHTLLTPMPTPTSDAPLLLTNNDIGTIISLQSLAYTISKFVGGIMSDAVSARLLLAVSLCLSGFLNINFTKDISVGVHVHVSHISFLCHSFKQPKMASFFSLPIEDLWRLLALVSCRFGTR